MKSSGELITTLSSHGLVLSIVKRVKRKMLYFVVILFEEKMIGEVIENHRVGGIYRVRLGQHLNSGLYTVWLLLIQFQYRKPYKSPDALPVELQSSFEG